MARQSKQSLEVQNRIAEYRLKVERKKGEWLRDNIQVGTNQYNRVSPDVIPTLKSVGVTLNESSKAQRIAALSEEG